MAFCWICKQKATWKEYTPHIDTDFCTQHLLYKWLILKLATGKGFRHTLKKLKD